ncbi:MAG: hypothetical protein M3Y41_06100 [Pseudomonadota bacterium]|nr:hypothetical protein [Pseudomonadota bacterium]
MFASTEPPSRETLDEFVALAGARRWRSRFAEIERQAAIGQRAGKAILGHHAPCYAIERLRRGATVPTTAEVRIGALAAEAVSVARNLSGRGHAHLRERLCEALDGDNSLMPLLHLLRTAALQRARGFDVHFAGLDDGASFDLLIARGGMEAEVACAVVSAEEGRSMHRAAWFHLADRIDPDLQTWLAAHPGRYLLRVSLPDGLQSGESLARLHERIRLLLSSERRADHDPAVVLRLDPLLLAGAQADELGLISSLKREFGPESHLSMTAAGGGVFVMAARAGRENDVAHAICRRMAESVPARLTGTRPGILAMFVEDTDRIEWRGLHERLELEGEARQFLTRPEARTVVAVTFASRVELFGAEGAAAGGELRFRNPAHPAARAAALSPAVVSSV